MSKHQKWQEFTSNHMIISRLRRLVFSPDNVHSISMAPLRDGTLLLTNEAKIVLEFSVSRNGRVLSVVLSDDRVLSIVEYRTNFDSLKMNTNYILNPDGLINQKIHTNPNRIFSVHLNFNKRVRGRTSYAWI